MVSPINPPHVIIFPFMAQGHTLPLLDLSIALSTQHIKVTIITTPANAKAVANHISNHPNIHITEIPFPTVENLPKGCENTSQLPSFDYYVPFLVATRKLRDPFEQLLRDMLQSDNPPICVVSDFFLGWTFGVCQALGVPRLVSHGMGALPMAICKSLWVNTSQVKEITSDLTPIDLPGIDLPFTLTKPDVPGMALSSSDPEDPFTQFIEEAGYGDINSWGIVLNSFEELEGSYVPSFESFYQNGAKAWSLGPLFLYNNDNKFAESQTNSVDHHNSMIIEWLDQYKQVTPGSVMYVAFGTQADISDAQLDEVAFGLEESGVPFVWVVRSKTWALPEKLKGSNCKGLVVREWVDQRRILSHPAVGGFLSHCGWNSVLESVAAGVPILAWPMMAEQTLNAKMVVVVTRVGISVKREQTSGGEAGVTRDCICEGVKELMGGEVGKEARERVQELGKVAKRAVQKGGSSHDNLTKMIGQLRKS